MVGLLDGADQVALYAAAQWDSSVVGPGAECGVGGLEVGRGRAVVGPDMEALKPLIKAARNVVVIGGGPAGLTPCALSQVNSSGNPLSAAWRNSASVVTSA